MSVEGDEPLTPTLGLTAAIRELRASRSLLNCCRHTQGPVLGDTDASDIRSPFGDRRLTVTGARRLLR